MAETRVRRHTTGRVTMYERPVFLKPIYQQYSFALGDQLLKLTKTTSRFKFNKLVSQTPIDYIHYAYDITEIDVSLVQQELRKVLEEHSITLVVALENHSPRGVL